LTFPPYVVSEYFVRRPLGLLTTWAEREDIPALMIDFFTFGEERKAGFVPTAFIDFGFRPSVGLYVFADDLWHPDHDASARVGYGGDDWWALQLGERTEWGGGHRFSATGDFVQRPDWLFAGFGPRSRRSDLGRYSRRDLKLQVDYDREGWRSSRFTSELSVHGASFDTARSCCGDPSVATRVAAGTYPAPPGSDDGYLVLGTSLGATLDTRRPRQLDDPKPGSDFVSPPGSGAELQLRAAHYASLRAVTERQSAPQRYQWVSYGATAAGFVDLTGEQRVVGLHVLADFTDPVQRDGVVPFDRQVSLGGPRPLRGFLEGRLRDRSATVALLDYRWPVWVWLDGTMHYAIGNVFGQHLDGFDLGAMRSSYGVGIQSNRTGDTPFQMLLALGTRTFDEGAGLDSVRLAIGSSQGF
jgi:hypothetical protein